MRILVLVIIFSLFGSIETVKSQVPDSTIINEWNELLKVDDNEKDYRFYSFLESVKEEIINSKTINIREIMPSAWGCKYSADSLYTVCTGIVPFQYQQSRLVVFVIKNRDKDKQLYSFYKNIKNNIGLTNSTDIVVQKTENDYSLKILSGPDELMNVPDIELRLLFLSLSKSQNDEEKISFCNEIKKRVNSLLKSEPYLSNDFNEYKELSTLISDNGKVKICTWNIEFNEGSHRFFGFVALNTLSAGIKIFELEDCFETIHSPEQASLTQLKWFGAIYYDLIETKYKGEIYYTLLGYNGNNAFSQFKVIDLLVITEGKNPNIRFGYPLFSDEKRSRKRVIFEYSKKATMMLRYDADKKMIVMDNLAPIDQTYQNDFRYYGPDFSYNGFKFEKGKWVLINDIDIRNQADIKK